MDYRELIKKHEGYRYTVYADSEGTPTVGWGHAFLDGDAPLFGTEVPYWRNVEYFEDDMQQVERDYCWLEEEFELRGLDFVRRLVLKNMLFNLGLGKLLGFRKMWRAFVLKDWGEVAKEMLDSKWARQVGDRAKYLSELMRLGRDHYMARLG